MNKRQLAWQWMSEQESFTTAEVATAIEMDLEQCRTTINKLKKQGFITHISGPGVPRRAKRYAINRLASNEPRLGKGAKKGNLINRQGKTGQQLVWNTLRINQKVTVGTVVAVTGCQPKSVQLYLRNLERAGYLLVQKVDTRLPNAEIAGQETLWRIKCGGSELPGDSGPKAPILRRGKGMYDPNRNKLYPFKEEASCNG
ncbi:hypothetical protein L1D40_07185 [Shewanella insulae]|uniref:hypothetical protein n=1 Tax=Shewanella insulae TaxID=2681496 RepID=UPI001EFD7ED7|nr:hypothetical protein [Shewanella insulae]MCG9755004.1 hypothetical protein [Shewanella insulae]